MARDRTPVEMDDSRRATLRIVAVLLLVAPPLYLGALAWLQPESFARLAPAPALVFVLAAVSLLLLARGRSRAAAHALVYGSFLAIGAQAIVGDEGLLTPQLAALPLGILLAGWLLGGRHAVAVTALGLALGLGLLLREPDSDGGRPSPPPLLIWLPRAVTALGVCLLALHVLRSQRARIDEIRHLNERLARERTQLAQIAENLPALIFHGDRDMRCLYANRQFADFFHGGGVPLEGMHLVDILGEAGFENARPQLERVLSGERVLLEGERLSKADGLRHLEISLVPERNGQGEVVGFYALKRDITERKQAEEKLREQNAFQEAFLKAQSDAGLAMFVIEAGRIVYANDAASRLFGYTREEMLSLPSYIALAHPDDRDRIMRNHQRRLRGETFENRYRIAYLTKAGERRAGELTAAFMPGSPPRVLVIVADVTEREAAEAALRSSEERLREAQRIGHVGSWEIDLATRRMTWSDELYRIYECGRDDFGGTWKDLLELAHPDDVARLRRTWREAARAEGNIELRHRILMPDGRVKHLDIRFEIFRDDAGRPVRALGTAQDVTEQVLAREEIQRLNADLERRVEERTTELKSANRELESFAYSISHDLRAPLRGIDGFSHLLLEEYGERLDETGRDYLDRVRRAAQRMGALIDDILELSRVTRQEMRRVPVDLSRIAAEIVEERARAVSGHPVQVSIAQGCIATGDPQLLRVLMQNLIENAWKYSAKNPAPRIEFGCQRDKGETVFFVRDNGVGFDMKYANRLFAPFQRLHKPEEFEGTGIGLATVARVVHRHGGRVRAEAAPGQGATFRFTLAPGPDQP